MHAWQACPGAVTPRVWPGGGVRCCGRPSARPEAHRKQRTAHRARLSSRAQGRRLRLSHPARVRRSSRLLTRTALTQPEVKPTVEMSISAEALDSLTKADGISASTLDSLIRIVGAAKELDNGAAPRDALDSALREEVQRVTRSLALNGAVSAEDVAVIKKEMLGPTTFWVTEAAFLEGELVGVRRRVGV